MVLRLMRKRTGLRRMASTVKSIEIAKCMVVDGGNEQYDLMETDFVVAQIVRWSSARSIEGIGQRAAYSVELETAESSMQLLVSQRNRRKVPTNNYLNCW